MYIKDMCCRRFFCNYSGCSYGECERMTGECNILYADDLVLMNKSIENLEI